MEEELVIRGSLEESSFPELLRSICKSKESGILTCFVNDVRKSVFIEQGQIVFATSSDMDDRLGESLLRYGKITVRNFLDATRLVRTGRRLGALLCSNNAITAEELVDGVRTQARDIILSLFEPIRGTYELVLKEIDTQEMIQLSSTTEDITFVGVKTIRSWSRISKGIASFGSIFIPTPDAEKVLMNLSLNPEESHIYSLCQKGRFNVEEVCGMSYLTNFETCRVLWGLMMTGALELSEAGMEKPSAEVPAPSSADAESDLHDLVEAYNDVFSYIYEYMFRQLGEGADETAHRAMLQVEGTMPNLARGLRLDKYGRLDFDAILKNLSPIPESARMDLVSGAMEEIMFALLNEVGINFGAASQNEVAEEVQKLRQHR